MGVQVPLSAPFQFNNLRGISGSPFISADIVFANFSQSFILSHSSFGQVSIQSLHRFSQVSLRDDVVAVKDRPGLVP